MPFVPTGWQAAAEDASKAVQEARRQHTVLLMTKDSKRLVESHCRCSSLRAKERAAAEAYTMLHKQLMNLRSKHTQAKKQVLEMEQKVNFSTGTQNTFKHIQTHRGACTSGTSSVMLLYLLVLFFRLHPPFPKFHIMTELCQLSLSPRFL